MAFAYRWMFHNDIVETADRFAANADQRLAGLPDFSARQSAVTELWNKARGLGWAGLLIEEGNDGAGGTLLDLAAMLEGAGRHALQLPLLAGFGIAPTLVNALGSTGASLARSIAHNSIVIMPAIEAVAKRSSGKAGAIKAIHRSGKIILDGKLNGVEAVPSATHIIVACALAEADSPASLLLCPIGQDGLSLVPVRRMDGRASADLNFERVALDETALLASGELASNAVETAADTGALLSCVETVAAMGSLIGQTVEYLSNRKQFGVQLASFQALRHNVADMFVAYETSSALLMHTLQLATQHVDDLPREPISLLKLRLSDAAGMVARSAIQLHGGMGLTEELFATRLARRILMAEFEYGSGVFHSQRLLTSRQLEVHDVK